MKHVFIVGCGDIGLRIARLIRRTSGRVFGLVRSEASAQRLGEQGIEVVTGDLDEPSSLHDLPTKDATIFYLAPPPSEDDTDPRIHNFLAAVDKKKLPAKFVLLSTTAVYGDCEGEWITEAQAVNPQTARGRRRLDAEKLLQQWAQQHGVAYVILRVGGIYGPGRFPIARIKQGLPILRERESPYTNRIHQDDLASICMAAAERGKSGEIFNISDGQPSTMSHYFKAIASAVGLPQPPEVSLDEAKRVMSAGMLSYLKESRRLDNRKLREQLGVELVYADLSAGLSALTQEKASQG